MRLLLIVSALVLPLQAFTIRVDYRFDSEGFFDNPDARAALEAAAARWSRIIDQDLLAVDIGDEAQSDVRFQLANPGTGQVIQLSAAASASSDFFTQFGQPEADVYLDGFFLEEDVWILFAGARSLNSSIALGGSIGLGINLVGVDEDPESIVNRGFNNGPDSLSVLGGIVSFDVDSDWHFGLFEEAPLGQIDFYTIALHEIGHGLGLNSTGNPQFDSLLSAEQYTGQFAVEAYNADNNDDVNTLEIVRLSPRDYHWENNVYQSQIFELGGPSRFGVVGDGELQDLLMDPAAAFSQNVRRLEVTNVEVGALRDLGWSVITEDPPAEPAPVVEVERSPEGVVRLSIPSRVERTYTIQTSISAGVWFSVSPVLLGDGSNLSWEDGEEGFIDPVGNSVDLADKFYRVIEN